VPAIGGYLFEAKLFADILEGIEHLLNVRVRVVIS
jgi:hypothetical protein